MMTAETENVIAAKMAGVSNYMVKPFNAATLKTKMDAVFDGQRGERPYFYGHGSSHTNNDSVR